MIRRNFMEELTLWEKFKKNLKKIVIIAAIILVAIVIINIVLYVQYWSSGTLPFLAKVKLMQI